MEFFRHIYNRFLSWLYGSYKVRYMRTRLSPYFQPPTTTRLIFIFGCQRSGTTLVQKIMDMDPRVKTCGEGDAPYFVSSSDTDNGRLIDTTFIASLAMRERNKFLSLKPLKDSQLCCDLMASFPDSRALWIFRPVEAVVSSHIHYYSESVVAEYKKYIFAPNDRHWTNEQLSVRQLEIVSRYSKKTLGYESIYALFWLLRNIHYLEYVDSVDEDTDRMLLVSYDQLVENPAIEIQRICNFVDLDYRKYTPCLVKAQPIKKDVISHIDDELYQECLQPECEC